uniref:Large ribosomal subunit protein uL22c n=1 Tax=Dipterocladia arabiensis TaxID=2007176 RepID=A0A1Z1M093_9FLOR|nr:ribosomal protein L22 [Dipterocladia arabiensis]ARW59426.1 ribosomal protein L22 [Dipterocladia arabiensis]
MESEKSKAISKYLRLSTHKARRVLEQIKGKKYTEARLMLEFMPYKACKIINKILKSAFSNIKQNSNDKNTNINTNTVIIKNAFANQGPTMKRFQPRAQGRAFPIRKPTCHITIELEII